ncbi:mechanosensitive ion channel family protein [Haloferax sp. S1W]|uniref:mechanosensitive ion channel family protein n=1 Tax=Haloferax sp. S1W TaxID=3377110 RepID=UPI0037CBF07B
MNFAALPLQLQGDGGAIGRFLVEANVPYAQVLGSILGFIVAFLVVYIVGKAFLSSVVSRYLDRRRADEHAKRPLMKLVTVIVAFVAIAAGFRMAGFPNILESLATIAAAGTLAIGFAMQNTIANFVAGIFIFTDRPFRINDWIEWDGHSGVVEDISFRVTRVRTFDNELLTVPNSQLTNDVIKNPVAKNKLRLQVPFGIGYDDDIEQATDIILEEALAHDGIMDTPEPSVRLTELGDSAVVLKSRIWISNPSRADFVKTRGEYVAAVKNRFDEAEIDFPYPNRTLSGELSVAGMERLAQSND